MTVSDFDKYIRPGCHGHLVGIGGVSMAPLAEVLKGRGLEITGSDINEGEAVKRLRNLGIDIAIGHDAKNIEGAEFIVRTAAAHDDNPEIQAAIAAGIPVFERAQAWGCLMRRYDNALCISGTHGKTTTTSMSTHILMAAEKDPTVMIGGTLPLLKAGHRVGHGDTIVMESCEYYNSFLSFSPTVAVILNVEADHLDFFKDLDDIKHSFRAFAELVPDNGYVVANFDDAGAMDAISGIDRRVVTFGRSEGADFRAVNIEVRDGLTHFDVLRQGEDFAHIALKIPGMHNVMNALAATTACSLMGVPVSAIRDGLMTFTGAARRFEFKGEYNGARIYDDYAHHPGELKALLDMVQSLDYKRVLIAFQPHTYSRTKALFNDFVAQLQRVDKAYLAEIYAAREQNTIGISSRDIAEKIPGSVYCATFDDLLKELKDEAQPGDIILTVGAGDIYKVGEELASQNAPDVNSDAKPGSFADKMAAFGFKAVENRGYGVTDSYPCVITAINSSHWRFTWYAPIEREAYRDFRSALRHTFGRGSSYIYEDDCLQVVADVKSGCSEVFDAVTSLAVKLFRRFSIKPEEDCPLCGKPDCDSYAAYKSRYAPVHAECVKELDQNEKAKAQYAAASGSLGYGILGALAGGIIGMILPLICIVLTTVFYKPSLIDVLFVVMPICVYQGYELLGGRRSLAAVPVTILGSVIFVLLTEVIYAAVLFADTYTIPYSSLPVLIGLVMRSGDMWIAILKAAVLAFLFCLIGLLFFWNNITYTAQKKLKTIGDISATITPRPVTESLDSSSYGYSDDSDDDDAAEEYSASVGIRLDGEIIPPPEPVIPQHEFHLPEATDDERNFSEEDTVDDTQTF